MESEQPQPTIVADLIDNVDFLRQRMNWHMHQIELKLDQVQLTLNQMKIELK